MQKHIEDCKEKITRGQSSNKICSLVHGKEYICSQAHSRQDCLLQVWFFKCSVWRTLKPLGALAHRNSFCGMETVCTSWEFNTKYLQVGAWEWFSTISKMRGSITSVLFSFGNPCQCNIHNPLAWWGLQFKAGLKKTKQKKRCSRKTLYIIAMAIQFNSEPNGQHSTEDQCSLSERGGKDWEVFICLTELTE